MQRHTSFLVLIAGAIIIVGGIFLWARNFAPLRPFEALGRGLSAMTHKVKSYRALTVENTSLKAQLEKQSIDQVSIESILEENNELKKINEKQV